jgi:hypothetical protein
MPAHGAAQRLQNWGWTRLGGWYGRLSPGERV